MPFEPEKSLNPLHLKPALLIMLEVNEEKGAKIVYSEGKVAGEAEAIVLTMAESVRIIRVLKFLRKR